MEFRCRQQVRDSQGLVCWAGSARSAAAQGLWGRGGSPPRRGCLDQGRTVHVTAQLPSLSPGNTGIGSGQGGPASPAETLGHSLFSQPGSLQGLSVLHTLCGSCTVTDDLPVARVTEPQASSDVSSLVPDPTPCQVGPLTWFVSVPLWPPLLPLALP